MCDYSLGELENRLAVEGEELILHRFPTHSLGLASPADLASTCCDQAAVTESGAPRSVVPAVCIPPGARLVLSGIPVYLQTRWNVTETEAVVFTQTSMEVNRHRDAVRFSNGHESLLQNLPEGVRAKVISLGGEQHPQREIVSANSLEPAELAI